MLDTTSKQIKKYIIIDMVAFSVRRCLFSILEGVISDRVL